MTTPDVKQTLAHQLRELRLPSFREHYEALARNAEQNTLSYEQYLLELANRECETRRANRIETMLRQSRLPLEKTLESFDLKRLPAKASRQVKSLTDGAFVDRCENVLAFGKPGSGKTHLLAAVSQELVRQGRRVLFCPACVQHKLSDGLSCSFPISPL